jgi:hypothetical protein
VVDLEEFYRDCMMEGIVTLCRQKMCGRDAKCRAMEKDIVGD